MFAGCNKIIDINFNSVNITRVNNMSYMFYNCENLQNLKLSCFNTRNIINMNYMFYNCKSLNSIDLLSGFIITIIYNIDKDEIQLFGDEFIKNNKDKCFLLIEGNKENLTSKWKLKNKDKNLLKIKLTL